MGVASLVLGIISIVIAFFGVGFQWLGVILGLLGIIFGALGRKNPQTRGIATGGLVCSIIGFCIALIAYIACAGAIGALMASSGY